MRLGSPGRPHPAREASPGPCWIPSPIYIYFNIDMVKELSTAWWPARGDRFRRSALPGRVDFPTAQRARAALGNPHRRNRRGASISPRRRILGSPWESAPPGGRHFAGRIGDALLRSARSSGIDRPEWTNPGSLESITPAPGHVGAGRWAHRCALSARWRFSDCVEGLPVGVRREIDFIGRLRDGPVRAGAPAGPELHAARA